MKRLALLLAASSMLAGPALAADLGLRPSIFKAEPVMPGYSWTGFYLGGHVGAGWGSASADLNSLTVAGLPAAIPLGLPLAAFGQNGMLGGGQIGANYQFSMLVVGVEAEGDWQNVKGHGPCLVVLSCSADIKWSADVAGRVGLALDRTLVYVKGGWAWAKVDTNAVLGLPGAVLSAPNSATRNGALIGTGIEQAIGHGWSAKLEYDFMDFGASAFNIPVLLGPGAPAVTASTNHEQKEHVIKFGVNYRFGG